jgi:hypothetical protein
VLFRSLEYAWKNATITEQILAIPNASKETLIQMIATNLEPANREYRYNFLFDNCTTRPRDLIEKCCGGKLIYPEQTEKITFRKLIHAFTNPYPWMTFGIDLLIGSGADSLLTFRQELFLPEKLKDALEQATVTNQAGETYPVTLSSEVIAGEKKQEKNTTSSPSSLLLSPLSTGILVLLIYSTLAIAGYRKKRRFRVPFALLLFIAGACGCLIAFLSLFSCHPCTAYNWNILWLHPLHFIGFAGYFFKKTYAFIRWYHGSNLLLLSALLLAWHWIPQAINVACIPFVLCLWLVSAYQLVPLKNKKI